MSEYIVVNRGTMKGFFDMGCMLGGNTGGSFDEWIEHQTQHNNGMVAVDRDRLVEVYFDGWDLPGDMSSFENWLAYLQGREAGE